MSKYLIGVEKFFRGEQTFESVGNTKKEAMDNLRTSNNFKNISGNLNINTMRIIKKINKKG